MEKQHILRLIEKKLESNIEELSLSLAGYEDASNMDESDTLDPDDFSKQAEHKEMQMRMQLQLDQARHNLLRLRELSGKDHDIVEVGALVETDKNWFFIGIAFSSMPVDHKELIGVSPESPAFLSFRGKKAGDAILLGKETYTIRAIQ